MNVQTKKISELLTMVENGKLIREAYQRTPSHTLAFAKSIIDSIIDGNNIGLISIAETEIDGVFALVDGSSRLQDFANLQQTKKIGKAEYSVENVDKILNAELQVVTYKGFETVARRAELFHKLNNSTALSGVQKHRTGDTVADSIVTELTELVSLCGGISDRMRQKDISYKIAVDYVLNVCGKYTATASKQAEALVECDGFNFDKFNQAFNKVKSYLSNNTDNMVTAWALTFGMITLHKNTEFKCGDWIQSSVDTAGANSVDKVNKGIKRFARLAKSHTTAMTLEDVTPSIADEIPNGTY